jgi:hypothetical protein
MKKFRIKRNFLPQSDLDILLKEAEEVTYRPCPGWLGNFNFKVYDKRSGPPSTGILYVAEKLTDLVDEQTFNTVFLQKYEAGEFVREHQDPRNNVGDTIIACFGDFDGATHTIDGEEVQVFPGDVLVQQCTVGYSMGPKHSVSEVIDGVRYALILNTIVENKTLETN